MIAIPKGIVVRSPRMAHEPGSFFEDSRGRKYMVAVDGSVRRLDKIKGLRILKEGESHDHDRESQKPADPS